jgi:membrane dipeptidase
MTTDHLAAARHIHADLPVVDGHNDLPWAIRTRADGDFDRADPSGSLPGYHTDIPRMLDGGVGGQFWSVYVPADSEDPHRLTLDQTELVKRMVAHDDRLELALTAADVYRIRGEGRIASLMGAEGGHSIENSLDKLHVLHGAGVRYMTLTHVDTIDWADSGTDAPRHGGLNDFGREVVREMNRLGMLVDVSHVSVDTMRDALDASRAPIIASHSNADALAPHPRNIPDDVLAAIGAAGGVVMVAFFSAFVIAETAAILGELYPKWREIRRRFAGDEERIRQEIERTEVGVEWDLGTVSDVVDHIEHVAAVAGVDAVGLGSDFDGCSMIPDGLDDVGHYPAITVELLRRGWTEDDIRGVLGNNILRVLEAAERLAG